DGAAGMGAGARPRAAHLSHRGRRRAGASPHLHRHGRGRWHRASHGDGLLEARGRGGGGGCCAGRAGPQPLSGESARRCGFVAIVGAPNAGKSTLLNELVGAKVSIVSPKVQTTRSRVLGIAIDGATQLVFIDTPGIFAPKRRLERAMVAAAW